MTVHTLNTTLDCTGEIMLVKYEIKIFFLHFSFVYLN